MSDDSDDDDDNDINNNNIDEEKNKIINDKSVIKHDMPNATPSTNDFNNENNIYDNNA